MFEISGSVRPCVVVVIICNYCQILPCVVVVIVCK